MKSLETIITESEQGYIDFHEFDNPKAFAVMQQAARKLLKDSDCGCAPNEARSLTTLTVTDEATSEIKDIERPALVMTNEMRRARAHARRALQPSNVPIEYRYNRARRLWETRDLGQPYGWVVSDAMAGRGPECNAQFIIGARLSRGLPNNRPLLIVESAE